MKAVYPIILTQGQKYVVVEVPDFQLNTQGKDMYDAIEMARDTISLAGVDMEDEGEPLPVPSKLSEVKAAERAVVTLVDVDFAAYRRKLNVRTVRRNISLPQWLDEAANEAGLNVSAIAQQAIKEELRLQPV